MSTPAIYRIRKYARVVTLSEHKRGTDPYTTGYIFTIRRNGQTVATGGEDGEAPHLALALALDYWRNTRRTFGKQLEAELALEVSYHAQRVARVQNGERL